MELTGERADAVMIVRRLRDAGFRAFVAGGAVRDMVMGIEPADYDIATAAAPAVVERLFDRVHGMGAEFGVCGVIVGEHVFEIAMFRREGGYRDGRHPSRVERTDEREDALRRDFTMNALLWDPDEDRIIDHVGGREDIERRVVRTVGDPGARFGEDRLRMLRAVRFAARFDFTIAPEAIDAIRGHARLISSVSAERIGDELSKIFTGPHPARALVLLDGSGLLAEVLPEISALRGVLQSPVHHPEGDVFEHTRAMLDLMSGATVTLAFGVLFHDVGKPVTRTETGAARFPGHDDAGEKIAEAVLKRLRMSGDTVARVGWLVRNHMRFAQVPSMKRSTLRRFIAEPGFGELLELHRLDTLARGGELSTWRFVKEEMERMVEGESGPALPEPLLRGDDLIRLGYEPGPVFREILDRVTDAQLEGRITTRSQALSLVRRMFPEGPSRRSRRRRNTSSD
jgi:poly(A) polymerase